MNDMLGQGIKMARIREGITQTQLADLIETSQAYIVRIEKGLIGYNNFCKILGKMGYTFDINIKKIEKVSVQD